MPAHGQPAGSILLGVNGAAPIVAPSITVHGLINMTTIAVYDAQLSAMTARV